MPTTDKTAIVISGGTARGAYAAGLVSALFSGHPELGPKVQIVSGTSTGSLIAPMLSLYLGDPVKNAPLLALIEDRYRVASTAVFRDEPKSCIWRGGVKLGRLLGMKEGDAQMVAMLGEGGTVLDTAPLRGIVDSEYT
ncbi:MAG: patatin-like phospholipase family protein, partial [Myxococcaceae bacterium]